MPKSPRLRGRELIAALHGAGFQVVRIEGSHRFLHRSDGCCTVVPVHSGEIVGPGLFNKIRNDIELEVEDLPNRLR